MRFPLVDQKDNSTNTKRFGKSASGGPGQGTDSRIFPDFPGSDPIFFSGALRAPDFPVSPNIPPANFGKSSPT